LGHTMNLRTARKKGTYTLKGGLKQQIWNCRECGRTWQTTQDGKIVDSHHKKRPAGE
jgi:hypothetical protein